VFDTAPTGHEVEMRTALRRGMLTVERSIAAPPGPIWDVLVNLDAWPKWGLPVTRAELIGANELALGVRGKVWTPFGVALPFTVIEFHPGHSWKWQVAGVPATRHEVVPSGDASILSFGVPLWAPAYLTVCAIAVQRIDHMVDC
jgi:uncharacterized protein YndB with AHSA1/START domain